MSSQEEFVMPADHTFTPGRVLIHKTAYERLEKLVEQALNRDPDAQGLYIYNDFYGYAILDLVDRELSSIHGFVVKKKWLDAWYGLTALTHLMHTRSDWTMVDDGDRVDITNKAYSALLVKTLRSLDDASQLSEETLPDLENTLTLMTGWAEHMDGLTGGPYGVVVKGYGKKLFGTRTTEERKRMREAWDRAYDDFVKTLSPEGRKKRGDMTAEERKQAMEEDEEDEEDEEKEDADAVWFGDAKASDINAKDDSFKITNSWKEYRECLANSPRVPMRGPAIWDLTKWSAKDKAQFSLGEGSDEDDMFF
ncbi:hypothetical protein EWM64_g3558 [Hericium alpestre]|uniref:Uncharacterized protein n=1 Tax=Hericium alpestre TaxID=135208 RepID=A0A4Z0A051_9AGAM|nr:hypothetical protein EWM64_g3558 [Hericium alpestre]